MLQALAQADAGEQLGGALASIAAPVQFQRQHDVLQSIEAVEQLERLKDETDVFGTHPRPLVFVERRQRMAGQMNFARTRQIEPCQQAEQCRLARP